MRISIHVKTRAKRPGMTHLTGSAYEVAVAALPIKGIANEAVVDMIAKYFGLRKSQVRIVSGGTSANKIVELSEMTS